MDNQNPTPNQQPSNPPVVGPPQPSVAPNVIAPTAAPAPQAPAPVAPAPAVYTPPEPAAMPAIQSFNTLNPAGPPRQPSDIPTGIFAYTSYISLGLSSLALLVFIILIFAPKLADSLTKVYIWFFVIFILSVGSLVMGILSERRKEKLDLTGVIGLILAMIIFVNCLVIGSYTIKLYIEANKFKKQYESSNSSLYN